MADLGEGPGGLGLPPFLDQTEAGRADKTFLETFPPPPYLRVWMTRPPTPTPLSQGLDPALTGIFLAERQDDPSTMLTAFARKTLVLGTNRTKIAAGRSMGYL